MSMILSSKKALKNVLPGHKTFYVYAFQQPVRKLDLCNYLRSHASHVAYDTFIHSYAICLSNSTKKLASKSTVQYPYTRGLHPRK